MFHGLANAYYREGEDADTPQAVLDSFIGFMFEKAVSHEIEGCFAKTENEYIGFALWAVDTADFVFSEIPGYGTILEIGLIPARRSAGHGKAFVSFVEDQLRRKGIDQCYVSAYGPAREFWSRCGYAESGQKAGNGLPMMVKAIGRKRKEYHE